jgi:hypothetical protein
VKVSKPRQDFSALCQHRQPAQHERV